MKALEYFGYTQKDFTINSNLNIDLEALNKALHKRYEDVCQSKFKYDKMISVIVSLRLQLKQYKNVFEIFKIDNNGKIINIVKKDDMVYFIEKMPDMIFDYNQFMK